MKILFLCGSVEPGKDGVGDYTRRLCGELIRSGYKAQIISLYDKHEINFNIQTQLIEETPVIVSRIPITTSYKQRLAWTQEIVKEVAPDWISLQFVPYSFHNRGLPFWLPHFLNKLKGDHKWHVMFHELWVGIEKEALFKSKCIGYIQKQIIKEIYKSIEPKIAHTQAKIYQHYLKSINIEVNYLPLFGNIPVYGTKNTSLNLIVFVVFATIHDKAPFKDFIVDLKREIQKKPKDLKFIFLGRPGDLLSSWTDVLDKHAIKYQLLGPSEEEIISQVFMDADYGISSTPYKISDKSGVVAAMREHQLSVISIAKPWVDLNNIPISFQDIVNYQKGNLNLNKTLTTDNNSLSNFCKNFLKSINNQSH